MYLITNGLIVTEDAILQGYDLLIQDDRIAKIALQGEIEPHEEVEIVDARGGYVSPGFIDIHSDYIEHMAAPRPTSLIDFELSLIETEKHLVSHGITTMYHSLAIFKAGEFNYRPIREPENMRRLVDQIEQTHQSKHLVRHRFHARFEIDNIEEIDQLKNYITEEKVHLISFMDHTPGQGQYRDLEGYRETLKGYNDLSDEQIVDIINDHQSKEKLTTEGLQEIAQLAAEYNIPIASHDDDTIEKLEIVESFGAEISEFPITMEVAMKAKEKGMHTVAGAPNVILGKSHNGNLSASEAVKNQCIDILCSDYYPASLLHAVFVLENKYQMNLIDMFKLVSLNPAKALNIDHDIGSIAEGKKADVLIIEKNERDYPVITTVFVDGQVMQRTNYRR
ncbi:phosphonate metabolism protein PhnM [Bacillaceae bacterium SIJ1]|uniref:phosphonate metabolism protein PhnM n=1 Tax=Litoribacterium kuwaitense TaxID=1398745 RepID=UPI0013E9A677|nr:phosphonate metabolism protein PhnM [Litoribacterium kuwaitense]NGP45085.1 phosphonate metabolism protein PhnM [Litoribacterium kuwaitense]